MPKKRHRRPHKRRYKKSRTLQGSELKLALYRGGRSYFTVFLLISILFLVWSAFVPSRVQYFLFWVSGIFGFFSLMFFWLVLGYNRSLKRYKTLESIRDQSDSVFFEHWTAKLLRNLGYKKVEIVGATSKYARGYVDSRGKMWGDGGVDVIGFSPKGEYTVIQCKKYAKHNWISVDQIRDFIGGVVDFKADKAIFITTSSFKKSCFSYAKRNNVELWDQVVLENKISKIRK